MFNYKNFLDFNEQTLQNILFEIIQLDEKNIIKIIGNKKSLLYFAARLFEFAVEESGFENSEYNFDPGVDLRSESSSLCVFFSDVYLEAWQAKDEKRIEIYGQKEGIIKFAEQIVEQVNLNKEKLFLEKGNFLTDNSSSIYVILKKEKK